MNSGTERTSGGAFERSLCELWVFGADGLVTRWEQFDAEQDAILEQCRAALRGEDLQVIAAAEGMEVEVGGPG